MRLPSFALDQLVSAPPEASRAGASARRRDHLGKIHAAADHDRTKPTVGELGKSFAAARAGPRSLSQFRLSRDVGDRQVAVAIWAVATVGCDPCLSWRAWFRGAGCRVGEAETAHSKMERGDRRLRRNRERVKAWSRPVRLRRARARAGCGRRVCRSCARGGCVNSVPGLRRGCRP